MFDANRFEEMFVYDLETGTVINRVSRGRAKEGEIAGYQDVHGYWRICFDYVKYYEHHIIWYLATGEWPTEIDHIDRDRSNNAISNLRVASRSQNNRNSERATGESGLKGAYLDHRVSRWYSKIQIGGHVKWLGHFDSAQEAHKAFLAAAEKYHGEFFSPPENQLGT